MHVLRRVLCVCTGLCVFVSRAEVQLFISGADCRQGEYSDLALLLFNFTYLLFGLFEDSLDIFCTTVELCCYSLSVHAPFP